MRYYTANHFVGRVMAAAVLDALCLLMAAGLVWFTREPAFPPLPFAGVTLAAMGCAFVLLYYTDCYGLKVLGSGRKTVSSILAALGVGTASVLAVQFAVGLPATVLETASEVTVLYVPLLLLGRLAFRLVSSHPRFSHRVLLIGNSDLSRAVAAAVRECRNLGTEIVGFLSDDEGDQGVWVEGFPVLGRVHEVEKVLEDGDIGRIVVASKRRDEHFPAEVLLGAKLAGIRVDSGVTFYERVTGRIYLRQLRPSYLIFNGGFDMGILSQATKRVLDLAMASVGLVCSLPFLALAALAIKLDDGGSVFFGQERVGRYGRPFRVWKLRSMREDAERDTGAVWSNPDDDRTTRVGRYLRKARIDELPQFWNVLRGDMSFVGPRPERPEFVESLAERYPYFRVRSALRPGITGWAQIRHGYTNDVHGVEDKLALDMYYLKYRSITMDLLIIWKTIKTVILLRGI